MQLERNTAWQWPQPGATFPEKPDSGHADTIGTTARVSRASWNVMKPQIQCVLTH
jgi:hypothetical protein